MLFKLKKIEDIKQYNPYEVAMNYLKNPDLNNWEIKNNNLYQNNKLILNMKYNPKKQTLSLIEFESESGNLENLEELLYGLQKEETKEAKEIRQVLNEMVI